MKRKTILFLYIAICFVSACKKEDENLPIKDLTIDDLVGTWISTNEPNKTVVMVNVDYNMWDPDAGTNTCKLYTITPTDTVLSFDGTFDVQISYGKGYLVTYKEFKTYTNGIYEYSANRILMTSDLPGGKREFKRTTSKLGVRKNIDFSNFKFYGNNSSGPCSWTGVNPQQISNSYNTQIVYAAEKGGKMVYAGVEPFISMNKVYYIENENVTQLQAIIQASGLFNYNLEGMSVVNNDVYIPAQVIVSNFNIPAYYYGYWKNDKWINPVGPQVNVNGTAETSSVVISGCSTDGTHIYISGSYWYSQNLKSKAFYYKDTTRIDLESPNNANIAFTSGISFSGNALFVCGSYQDVSYKACYWKNGTSKALNYNGNCRLASVIDGLICTIGAESNGAGNLQVFTTGDKIIHSSFNADNIVFTSIQANNEYYFIPSYNKDLRDYNIWVISKDLKNSDLIKVPLMQGNIIRTIKVPN